MPQLDPTWYLSQLFWLVVTFTFLYVMLARVVLPPLMQIVEQRSGTVSNNLARAEVLKAEAEAARVHYEQALSDARTRAQALFAEAEAQAKKRAEAALADLDRATHARMQEAETRIQAKMEQLRNSMQGESVVLAQEITQKLAGFTPSPDAAAKAVERAEKVA